MKNRGSTWLIPVLLTGVAAVGLWYYWQQMNPAASPPDISVAEPPPLAQESGSSGPRYPLPETNFDRANPSDLIKLPPLDQSDDYFRLDMAGLFGNGIAELLTDTAVIEKIVATIDNLPRNQVAERIRPIGGVIGSYLADGQDGSGLYTVNSANFKRYDFLVNLLATADLDALVEIYQRFYPLFQEAYAGLGYPQAYFNDRVIEVIDHLLETPTVQEPVELVRPHVLFEHADPELEALSSGQKLLLRLGDDHAVRVKEFLEEVRERIAKPAA